MPGTCCLRHPFELSANVCCSCGHDFCGDCLVYPRGASKPPLCVPCAVAAAGVRSTARLNRAGSKREVKRRVRARRAEGFVHPDDYAASRDPFGLKLAGWAGPQGGEAEQPPPEPGALPVALPTVFEGGAPRPTPQPIDGTCDADQVAPPFDVAEVLQAPSPALGWFDDDLASALAASPSTGTEAEPDDTLSAAGDSDTETVDGPGPHEALSWFDGPAEPPVPHAPAPVAPGFDADIVPHFDDAPPWAVADLDLDEDEPLVTGPVSVPRLRVAAPAAPVAPATGDRDEPAEPGSERCGTTAFPPGPPKPKRRATLAPLPGAPPALPIASPHDRNPDALVDQAGRLPSSGS